MRRYSCSRRRASRVDSGRDLDLESVITLAVFAVVIVIVSRAGRVTASPQRPWRCSSPTARAMSLLVVAFSLASSVLFLRYRDLNQVWDVMIQAGFFIAPIIYPLGILPERFHFYLYLWPPTPVIEFSRACSCAEACRA